MQEWQKNLNFVTLDEGIIRELDGDRNLLDILHVEDTLDMLGFPEKRATCDDKTNTYGYKLLEFCQLNMLYIFNGRVGRDRDVGLPTSKSNSVIDYAIGSPQLLACAKEFEVLVFDRLFSDIHAPIHVAFRMKQIRNAHSTLPMKRPVCNKDHIFSIVWDNDKKDEFVNSVDRSELSGIMSVIDNNCDVNSICDKIARVFVTPAKQVFRSVCTTCPRKESNHVKPWFNDECNNARAVYRRVKGCLRLDRTNLVLQAEMSNANKAYKRTLRKAKVDNRKSVERY